MHIALFHWGYFKETMCFTFIFSLPLSLSLTGHAVPAAQGEAGPAQLVGGVCPVISPHQGLYHGSEGHGGVQEDTSSGTDCEELSAVYSRTSDKGHSRK